MTHYCLGCMRQIDQSKAFCRYCGFNYERYMEQRNENSIPPGTMLNGRYLLGKVLGAGGFGITYLGLDTKLERKVAIKEYYPVVNASRTGSITGERTITVKAARDPEAFQKGLDGFLDEAKTLAGFNKAERKAVVSVIDFFHANGTGYMVMEYLPGPTLKQIVKSRSQIMTQKRVYELIGPVLDSLTMIHQQGLIHRDISPDNLMMDESGKLILIDFGASRSTEMMDENGLTVVLKHGFAPYEQYKRMGEQGPWTDVYAICATIYYMITGAVPMPFMERVGVDGRGDDRLKTLKELGIPVSDAFSRVIEKGLSLAIEDRYQTVAALKEALTRAVQERAAGETPETIAYEENKVTKTSETSLNKPGGYIPGQGRNDNPERIHSPHVDRDNGIQGGGGGQKWKDDIGASRRPPEPPPQKDRGRIALFAVVGLICIAIILVSVIWLLTRNSDDGSARAGQETTTTDASAASSTESSTAFSTDASTESSTEATTAPSTQPATVPSTQPTAETADAVDGSQPSYLTCKYEGNYIIQIYSEPDEHSKKVPYGEHTCLPESAFVALLEKKNGYSKIWYGGVTGWVKSKHLIAFSDTDDYYMWKKGNGYKAYVFQSSIVAHEEATDDSPKLSDKLKYGKEVYVQEVKNGFARIRFHDQVCWVDMHYLRTYAKKNKKWRVDTAQEGDSGKTIHLRKKGSETSASLANIPNGTGIKITKFKKGWGKTTYKGKDGWVKLKDCTPVAR